MIGLDLQEVDKIKNPELLLDKIALQSEKDYIAKFRCDFKIRVASLWATKEAVFKAMDLCEGDISYKEIEVCHKENGAPYIKVYGKAKESLKDKQIEISISHQKSVVGAVAIIF